MNHNDSDAPLLAGCVILVGLVVVIGIIAIVALNVYIGDFRTRCMEQQGVVVDINGRSVCLSPDLKILEVSRW